MTFWTGIGLFIGLAIGAVILFVSKKINKNQKYDERQLAARGNAYKAGFITFVICELVIFFVELFTEQPLVLYKAGNLQMLVTLFSALVFVEYSIFADAYYYATQKFSLSWCIIMLLLGGTYVLQFILAEEKQSKVLILGAGVMIIVAMISLIIKQALNKKEALKLEEEDSE